MRRRIIFRVITSILLCIVAGTAQAQDQERLTEVDLRVKGVGLGSSYAQMLRQLGRPISSRREKIDDETCGPKHTLLTVKYKGVVIELVGDPRGRDFKVVSFEITSPQLLMTPGIKLGMSELDARSKIGGEPWQVQNDSGFQILNYVTKGNDGGVSLYFRNDRLVKIQWAYTAC